MQKYIALLRSKKSSIGFVPTMGALHAGHQSLVLEARKVCDVVVVSIFVNPAQFNEQSDLDRYPRTIAFDLEKLIEVGCDVVYAPEVGDVYPNGLDGQKSYDLDCLESVLEGKFRPGHFQGVARVIERLLSLVNPHKVFMGQKDYQQCAVIHRLLELMKSPIVLVPCPTIREDDGLAMSSRNARLTVGDRIVAKEIYKSLRIISEVKEKSSLVGEIEVQIIRLNAFEALEVEYLQATNAQTLMPLEGHSHEPVLLSTAVWCGGIRLIDNVVF